MSTTQRLVRSFGATIVGPLVTVVVQLVNVPVMLRLWGSELYGEWLLLSAIPTYLLLTDLGFGNVAGSDMTMRTHAGDRQGALETFHSTLALVLLLTVCIGAAILPIVTLLPIHIVLHLHALQPHEARWTLLLLSLNCLVMLQWSTLMAAYRCTGRYARGMLVVNAIRILEAASFLALVGSHARPTALAALMLTVSLCGTTWLVLDHRRNVAWLPIGLRFATRARIHAMARPALAYMAFPACAAIGTQGMTLVTGLYLGPVAVALFNPMRTLSRIAVQLTDAVRSAMWPELSAAYGRDDVALARSLHRVAIQLSTWLATASVAALAIAGPATFVWWTSGRLRFDAATFGLLLMVALASSIWSASSVVSTAANRHESISRIYLMLSAGSLALACLLLPRIGLRGTALAMLVTDLGMCIAVLRSSNRLLSDTLQALAASLLDLRALRSLVVRTRSHADAG